MKYLSLFSILFLSASAVESDDSHGKTANSAAIRSVSSERDVVRKPAAETHSQSGAPVAKLMPRAKNQTSMWWRDGFPPVVPGAPWHRCIRTGNFGFVFDTTAMKILHLGTLSAESDDSDIFDLPAADLSLSLTVGGKVYHCKKGGEWTRFTGPRLIESGRFFQRGDITDLVFTADDGSTLNSEMRLETAAWTDRLSFILEGRPGLTPISTGEASFGRVKGGFGLNGQNVFSILSAGATHAFTIEFWTFVPENYQAGKVSPWIFCRGDNELADGNIGIMLHKGAIPEARMNLGGGRENAHFLRPESRNTIKLNSWNHLAVSYDNETLRLYSNGHFVAEEKIGKQRVSPPAPITFGCRGDKHGDGYPFRGVIDEVRYYDRALTVEELRQHFQKPQLNSPALNPIKEWTFSDQGKASMTQLREKWSDASMEIKLTSGSQELERKWQLPPSEVWSEATQKVALALNPTDSSTLEQDPIITVTAVEAVTNKVRPVEYDEAPGWHRINLDGVEPLLPKGTTPPSNDALERINLVLANPGDAGQVARLMFEKTAHGFRQRIGTPITGISAMLRDRDGHPTGIPVQLSKNWHNEPEGGVYAGQWFHGISQVRLPAKSSIELELTIAYGHWGGVPAASHAQLSLIGWGGNQRWDQSALGSWGESICYDPEQTQAKNTITDVRPFMVTSMGKNPQWGWTHNVGGGDFIRLFNPAGERTPHSAMQATYHRHGPCLTEATYSGAAGPGVSHETTVSLGRTDDLVRGTYQIRLTVTEPVDFSRFVIFQTGADTYSYTGEKQFALGDASGLKEEWNTQWGGDIYRTRPKECLGENPWISLHEAVHRKEEETGAWANRGIVIREWKARLGGKEAAPWIAERGITIGSNQSSTLDLVPPPEVLRLEPGDFVEAVIEHIIVPQFAADYYGPNEALREALTLHENTWKMIHREAKGNARNVDVTKGKLAHRFPDIEIQTDANAAEFTLNRGIGYVPVTFSHLNAHRGFTLFIDGKPFDQSVHGNDFWQTDFDAETGTWSQTYNLSISDSTPHQISFGPSAD